MQIKKNFSNWSTRKWGIWFSTRQRNHLFTLFCVKNPFITEVKQKIFRFERRLPMRLPHPTFQQNYRTGSDWETENLFEFMTIIIMKRLYSKKSLIKKGAGRPSMRINGRPRCPSQIAPTQNAQYRGMQEKLMKEEIFTFQYFFRRIFYNINWDKVPVASKYYGSFEWGNLTSFSTDASKNCQTVAGRQSEYCTGSFKSWTTVQQPQ